MNDPQYPPQQEPMMSEPMPPEMYNNHGNDGEQSQQGQFNSFKKKEKAPAAFDKVPPQAIEVEKSLLGSALIDETVLDAMMERVSEDIFYSRQNRTIYEAMKTMYNLDRSCDLTLLAEQLRSMEKLVNIGGETYLAELVSSVATSANIDHYVDILEDKMLLRRLIHETGEITSDSFEADAIAKNLIEEAEQKIFAISENKEKNRPEAMSNLLANTFKRIEEMSNTGGITGVQSGFTKLDELTTGFHPGELIIVAARPGMGKTAFCLSLAANASIRVENAPAIALFSLEMPKEQLVQRMLCSEAEVDMHKLRGGYLGSDDMGRLANAGGRLHKTQIYIDDTAGISPMEIRAKCRRIKSQAGNLGLIIIDYLQLMKASEKTQSRQEEVGSISRTLKEIAKEMMVPVIALAQLSRATEQNGSSKRPMLSHLRESGSIEQDADIVLFVHRESYYMDKNDEGFEEASRLGEIIIGKQRNGPLDDVPVAWTGMYTRFDNLDEKYTTETQDHF